VGNLTAGKFVVDGYNLHKGGDLLCIFPHILLNKCMEMGCIATLFMLFVKMLLRENKSRFFSDKLSITNKDMWLSVGSAPCTFKLTNSWR
jgi:hypothetical protein